MSKYTYKLYAVYWVSSGRVFSCFSQYTSSRVNSSYMTHWNFLPSKFLERHTMNSTKTLLKTLTKSNILVLEHK